MHDRVRYVNSVGEELEFGYGELYVNENDLRDFAWTIKSRNNRISGFRRGGMVNKTIPIVLKAISTPAAELKNRVFETFEKDVLNMTPGRIYVGDYYLSCYITGQDKSDYTASNDHVMISAKVSTDRPYWVRETTRQFHVGGSSPATGSLDYENDFPYDYTPNINMDALVNEGFAECKFRMKIYGPATSPSVIVGGHTYGASVNLEAGEYLTIDSAAKTITKTANDGTEVNCFAQRNKDSYIFQPIAPGTNNVNETLFDWDITLLEERSEPRWT